MSKVAVLRTSPETVVEDYGRLMDLAGYREALPFAAQTCLRINISWHVYMPACSTTPWQMHGVIHKLKRRRLRRLARPDRGAERHRGRELPRGRGEQPPRSRCSSTTASPIQYLSEPPTEWVRYEPKGKMLVLDRVFEKQGIQIPKLPDRQERDPHADGEDARLHRHDRRDEERVRRAAQPEPPLDALGDPRDAGRPAADPEGDPPRHVRGDGRHDRRRRPRPARMRPHVKNFILASNDWSRSTRSPRR